VFSEELVLVFVFVFALVSAELSGSALVEDDDGTVMYWSGDVCCAGPLIMTVGACAAGPGVAGGVVATDSQMAM
jgi:hypothetical protein